MGRHADEQRRRGIAAWPIVTGLAVLVIGGLLITYIVFLKNDSAPTDAACTSAHTVEVVAGPEAAPVVTQLATQFNTTSTQARGACLGVNVTEMDSTAAATALAQDWGQATPAPAVWIPDTAGNIADLRASRPTMTAGMVPDPLATSPVVLAMSSSDAQALATPLTWSALAAPEVRLGLADPQSDAASFFALQSVLAPSGTEAEALTEAEVTAGTATLTALAATTSPTSGATSALTALADGSADFTAVPVAEKDLADFNTDNGDSLSAVYPVGAAAGYSITAIGLAAPWVDATAQDGASAFISYLAKDESRVLFQQAGFRVADLPSPAAAHGIDPSTAVTRYPGAGSKVAAAMATVVLAAQGEGSAGDPTTEPTESTDPTDTTEPAETTEPSAAPTSEPAPETSAAPEATTSAVVSTEPAAPPGPVITFVVDASAGMSSIEQGQTLTAWAQAALSSSIANHPTNAFGLFSVSNAGGAPGYTQLVPTGDLADPVGAGTRADALAAAIAGLSADGSRWTYAAIINAYQTAVDTAVPDRPNRVIMIIDGPDLTPSTPRSAVIDTITAAQGKGVVLDIIGLGTDPPAAALTEITAASGGTYTSIATAAELPGIIEPLLAG